MSQPGILSNAFKIFQNELLLNDKKVSLNDQGQFKTFWLNRMDCFQERLINLARELSESGSIPTVNISGLPQTVVNLNSSNSSRKSAQRVILYGLFKRYPKSFQEDIFKVRESQADIEDIIPGSWIPTIENLPRTVKIDNKNYDYSNDDAFHFEDYSNTADSHVIELAGKCLVESEQFLMTGQPAVVIGRFNFESSRFDVEKFELISMATKIFPKKENTKKDAMSDEFDAQKRPTPKIAKKILILSDINLGDPSKSLTQQKAALKILLSNLAASFYGKVENVVILGGIFHRAAWQFSDTCSKSAKIETDVLKLSSIIYNKKIFNKKGEGLKANNLFEQLKIKSFLEIFDSFLCNLLEMCPVTLFPSRYDLVYDGPPFLGFSRELFVKACSFKNFRVVGSSIGDMVFKGSSQPSAQTSTDGQSSAVSVLGVSHRLSVGKNSTEIALQGLELGNLLPGAPYPEIVDFWYTRKFKGQCDQSEMTGHGKNLIQCDPFLLSDDYDHDLILIKGEDALAVGLLKNDGVNILNVQVVPGFKKGVVVYDFEEFGSEFFEN